MKNKLIAIFFSVLLVIGLICFWGYNKYYKPDPQIQELLNNQFGEDFFTSFNIDPMVPKDSGATNESQPTYSNQSSNAASVSEAQEESQVLGNSTSGQQTSSIKSNTENQISAKYKPKFNNLQNMALSRLDTLYSAAVQEYGQRKKAGTLNRSELIQKYMQAATILEANVDSQFYSTLNGMKAELVANNLPTDIIETTKQQYENAKSDKRSQLLSKAYK